MNEQTILRVVAWVVLYFVGSLVAELLFEFTGAVNGEKDLKPVAVIWFIVLGLAGGFATGGIIPNRMLPPGPFRGVSVLILPVALSGYMAIVGWARAASRSHLASWYGGAAVGFGLAVGRLLGLAFVAEVRAL